MTSQLTDNSREKHAAEVSRWLNRHNPAATYASQAVTLSSHSSAAETCASHASTQPEATLTNSKSAVPVHATVICACGTWTWPRFAPSACTVPQRSVVVQQGSAPGAWLRPGAADTAESITLCFLKAAAAPVQCDTVPQTAWQCLIVQQGLAPQVPQRSLLASASG